MSVIPTLSYIEAQGPEIQGHPKQQRDSEAILGYETLCLNK